MDRIRYHHHPIPFPLAPGSGCCTTLPAGGGWVSLVSTSVDQLVFLFHLIKFLFGFCITSFEYIYGIEMPGFSGS